MPSLNFYRKNEETESCEIPIWAGLVLTDVGNASQYDCMLLNIHKKPFCMETQNVMHKAKIEFFNFRTETLCVCVEEHTVKAYTCSLQ